MSKPAPIDPNRRIPFSREDQIAEAQLGSGGRYPESQEARMKRPDIREGFYIGGGGGLSLANNADNRKSTDTFVADIDPKIIGFDVSGVVGMKFLKISVPKPRFFMSPTS